MVGRLIRPSFERSRPPNDEGEPLSFFCSRLSLSALIILLGASPATSPHMLNDETSIVLLPDARAARSEEQAARAAAARSPKRTRLRESDFPASAQRRAPSSPPMRSATDAASLYLSTAARRPILVFAIFALSARLTRTAYLRSSLARSTGITSVDAEIVGLDDSLAGRQFAPLWPSSCLATTWHSRLQNHTFRHRPQSRSLPPLLPQAWHEVAAEAIVDRSQSRWLTRPMIHVNCFFNHLNLYIGTVRCCVGSNLASSGRQYCVPFALVGHHHQHQHHHRVHRNKETQPKLAHAQTIQVTL